MSAAVSALLLLSLLFNVGFSAGLFDPVPADSEDLSFELVKRTMTMMTAMMVKRRRRTIQRMQQCFLVMPQHLSRSGPIPSVVMVVVSPEVFLFLFRC